MLHSPDHVHSYSVLAHLKKTSSTPPPSSSYITAWVDELPTPPQAQLLTRSSISQPLAPISTNPQRLPQQHHTKAIRKRRAISLPPQDLRSHPSKIQSIGHTYRRSARLAASQSKMPSPNKIPPQGHPMSMRERKAPDAASLENYSIPQFPPVTPKRRKSSSPGKASSKSTSKARTPSPTKSGFTDDTTSSTGITKKEQLAQLSPSITFWGIAKLGEKMTPEPARDLWLQYIMPARDELKIVPEELKGYLKEKFDTPMKSRAQPADHTFGVKLYDAQEMTEVRKMVLGVFDKSNEYRGEAPEDHWVSAVAGRLIEDFTTLSVCAAGVKRGIEPLNISTTSIRPLSLCATSLPETFPDLNKRIDYALSLRITGDEKSTFTDAATKYRVPGPASINQTYSFTAFKPMFANIEFKVDDRDPLIQLGGWIAAEYEKRSLEGYPMDIPVPAIVVYNDEWHLYIAYSMSIPQEQRQEGGKSYRVRFVGPVRMGHTSTVQGIFTILHFLKVIVHWAYSVYEPDYFDHLLARYEE